MNVFIGYRGSPVVFKLALRSLDAYLVNPRLDSSQFTRPFGAVWKAGVVEPSFYDVDGAEVGAMVVAVADDVQRSRVSYVV